MGLTAALRLAEAGWQVTLIERESYLGGLAAGFKVGDNWLEKFYHHIFTTDTTIIRTIQEMGLGERLLWGRPNTSTLDHGRMYSLGGILDLFRLGLLSPVNRLRLMAGMAILKLAPNERVFAGQAAAAWLKRIMGQQVYRAMWEPVLIGKFGNRAPEIAMSWMWSRVHERSLRLGYVRGGFQLLYDAMGERIRSHGGTIQLGTSANKVTRVDGEIQVETDRETLHFDRVLATLPSRLFAQIAPQLGSDFVAKFPGPDHYGAHVMILALDRVLLPGVYWLNINDRDLPFLAVVEHTNFLPPSDYAGNHLVYLGNYRPMDDPLFQMSDAEVGQMYDQALKRIRPDYDRSWVKQSWVFKAPYAQPIVTADYLSKLPPHRLPIEGVYLANMAHVYPQDRGQNYSIRLGERLAHMIVSEWQPRASVAHRPA